jgi:hypothetical protein
MTIHCGEFCEQLSIHFKLTFKSEIVLHEDLLRVSLYKYRREKTLQTKAAEMNEKHIFSACV